MDRLHKTCLQQCTSKYNVESNVTTRKLVDPTPIMPNISSQLKDGADFIPAYFVFSGMVCGIFNTIHNVVWHFSKAILKPIPCTPEHTQV